MTSTCPTAKTTQLNTIQLKHRQNKSNTAKTQTKRTNTIQLKQKIPCHHTNETLVNMAFNLLNKYFCHKWKSNIKIIHKQRF